MARYIDVEGYRKLFDEEYKKTRKLISEGETHLDNLAEGFSEASRVIDRMPTADVVPKSEVEMLQEEAKQYKRYFFRHDYDEMIAEVLDKLDRFINSNCIEIKDERGIKGYVTSSVHFAIAELKKKYTGG